jgi:hypothetical protein
MSFLSQFVSNFIKRTLMEDPVARREARNKHIAEVSAKAAELCVPSRAGEGAGLAGLAAPGVGLRCGVAWRGCAAQRALGFDAPCLCLSRHRSKASWALPPKVPGFWREDANNAGVRSPDPSARSALQRNAPREQTLPLALRSAI